jgi:hypothetical protein
MKKIFFLLLSLLSTVGFSQIPGIVSSGNNRGSSPFQLIDSVSVQGMRSASTRDPECIIARTDETVELTADVFYNGVESDALATYTWSVEDAADLSIDFTGSGKTVDVSALVLGRYNVTVTATSLNGLPPREYLLGLFIEPPIFSEGEADLVIDLAQLQTSTWSNPLGNLDASDQGTNSALDFGDVSRPGFRIGIKNNFTGVNIDWIGLVGTEANPVRIQNVGGVVTNLENGTGVLWQFGTGSNGVTIDGYGLGTKDGIKFMGKTTSGDQSQLIYFIGNYIKNIKILGVYFDQTRDVYGFSAGGASVQFTGIESAAAGGTVNASCNGNVGDPGYFTPGYFWIVNCTFLNARDEPIYLGHFDDTALTGIYRPYRVGYILVVYNYFEHCGRDFGQNTATTGGIVACNYGTTSGLEDDPSQNTSWAYNDGNTGTFYLCKNFFEEVDMLTSIQNGFTGSGTLYVYSNKVIQRSTGLTNPNQFIFYNIEDQLAMNAFFFNNTLIAPDVNNNPWADQHDAPTSFPDLTLQIKGNVTSSGGSDDSPYPFVRDIGLPSAPNRAAWVISNTQVRTASQATLKLNGFYMPNDVTSPALASGFDLSSFNLPGGNNDIDGYSNFVNGAFSAGCFSGHKLFLE